MTAPYATFAANGQASPNTLPDKDLIDAYKAYGALLLRGFDMDLTAFSGLTQRLCLGAVFNETPSRDVIDRNQSIQTVDRGQLPFPLHPEISREPWKPDVCFFWCIQAPIQGGETTVCDGVSIVRRMPAAVRAAFATRNLLYRQPATPAECAFWLGSAEPSDALLARPPPECPYTFERSDSTILRSFLTPALHKPMFTDELAFGNFLFFARYKTRNPIFPTFENGELISDALVGQVKIVADRLEAPVAWRHGDVLILDNTRFMHGRRQIVEVSERRIATYFGYLRFAELDPRQRQARWRQVPFKPPGLMAQRPG
jgi:hypothetical protein